jgi:hypothetical protein
MRYEIQPLGAWNGPVTGDRPWCRFRAPWPDTLDLLGFETDKLSASLVVIQIDVVEGDLRRDGMLRANARVGFPGVRVSFTSRFGPLMYATDRFGWWQDNIRAVALSLTALRAVDRYGVNQSGEQYTGWKAIGAAPAPMTRETAAGLIAEWAEPDPDKRTSAADAMLRSPSLFVSPLYKRAAKRAHPDITKDDGDTMARLSAARELLLVGESL